MAYTYNEPLVGYEYVRDCAAIVHDRGMANVLVSNGTIEEQPWRELLPYLDAANIDLKGFTPEWYRRLGSDLDTVKHSIALAAGRCHVEVTTLLVPGGNDSVAEIRGLTFLVKSLPGERANNHETALTERIALYRVSRIQIALLDIRRASLQLIRHNTFQLQRCFFAETKKHPQFFPFVKCF